MLTRNCFRVFRKHTQFLIIFIITCSAGCSGNSERLRQTFAAQNETALTAEAENEISAASADGNGFHDSADEWFVFKKNGKYGYLNPNGEWMIQPKYETAFPFIEGIALVSLDGKKFLIDSRERSVPLPDGVTDVSTFKGGLAPVTIGGKTGFINRWGKLVTQPFIDFPASGISLPPEDMRMVIQDSLFSFVDSSGKIIRQPGFEYALDFYEGLALVSNQGKYGYMDKTGKIVIPMHYDVGWSFSEGLALAGTSKEENLQLSFIDHSGKVVIPVPYKIINPRFINGLTYFGIEKNGTRKYGFIDRTGKTIIEPVYDKVEEIISSSAKDLGKVIAFKVKSGELWGLISSDIVIKPAFSEIAAFREGLASASTGTGEQQKYGFIDTKGNWIIQPLYDEVNDFAYGLASVRIGGMLDGKWGYIDTNGKMVIEPQFRYAYNFLGNIALVQRGNGKAIIDRTGKVLVEE